MRQPMLATLAASLILAGLSFEVEQEERAGQPAATIRVSGLIVWALEGNYMVWDINHGEEGDVVLESASAAETTALLATYNG